MTIFGSIPYLAQIKYLFYPFKVILKLKSRKKKIAYCSVCVCLLLCVHSRNFSIRFWSQYMSLCPSIAAIVVRIVNFDRKIPAVNLARLSTHRNWFVVRVVT